MRSEAEFLDAYAVSHRHPFNQRVHMICVPLIFMATLGMFWEVPLDGLLPFRAGWFNLATVATVPILFFYARLSPWSLRTGMAWTLLSLLAVFVLWAAELPVFATCAVIWVVAWIGQFWGHKVEGAKPSFADDLVFLLIGPLFVQRKFQGA